MRNRTILGSSGVGAASSATGVRCEDAACSILDRNLVIAGTSATAATATGISLGVTGPIVSASEINAGCATTLGVGLQAQDAFARIESSVLRGSICTTPNTAASWAARILAGTSRNEVDLHSSTLFAQGGSGACTSRTLGLDVVSGTTPGPRGLFRNLILLGGSCATSYVVDELSTFADPRVFVKNDVWPTSSTALYRDEASTNVTTIAGVNALTGFSGNIANDPGFSTTFRLSSTSACRDIGTSEGAPPFDIDRKARPIGAGFDLGADEYKP